MDGEPINRPGLPGNAARRYLRQVRFRILGPLEVSEGSGPIPLGGPKQRLVLAHLLLRANQVVAAEHLIDARWGEEPPEAARGTLQAYVSRLRSVVGPERIEGRSPGYVVRVGPEELDLLRFESLVREAGHVSGDPRAALDTLTEALRLWRGPAIADLAGESSLQGEIARLEELRLEATEGGVSAQLEVGRHGEVVAELESLVAEHPLRERLWGSLILALYRSGRQAEAVTVFQRVREILADELGIDPSKELQHLHERILRQDPDLDVRGEPLRGYRLLEQIGEGAFGVVHRALQPQVGREVAIKAVHPELANHPDFVRRFEREAQVVARLEHPHVVPLYDYWREPAAAYLVMRFLRGGSLAELLREGPLDTERTARILDQVASALTAAHRQGVVHRDVKPGNILLDEEGNAYLTDFGVALDAGAPEKTSGAMLRATPAYLSPEQIRLEPATRRSDIYALGVVLYEALTGAHPFPVTSLTALLDRHLNDEMPSVRATRPELPAAVDEVVRRAMAKDPDDRFPDAAALATAFRSAFGSVEAVREPIGEIRNPYKGLRAFLEADAADFFGREELTRRLLQRLAEDDPGSRFLAVVGPSGSGKSSVVRAGLVPALRGGSLPGSDRWYVVELMPGAEPLRELESALRRVAIDPPSSILSDLERDEHGLVRAVDRVLPDADAELLIVLDQMEELFTLVEDVEVRSHVLASLRAAALEPDSRIRIVATLRADFFDQPLSVRGFGDLLASRTEAITPMSPEELERAIVGPADPAGLVVEPRLLAAMIADVADRPGGLPLLEYALTELADRQREGVLTLDAYRRIGGVSGALARRAEQLFEAVNETARDACRQLFLRLVTLGEGSEDMRRRVRRSELLPLAEASAMQVVIEAFGRHRLLSFDRDPITREPTVEIAHEALLGAWGRLRGWIDEAREDIRTQRRLAVAVAEWKAAERDPSFLARGSRLEQVQAWTETTTLALSDADRAYVEESTAVQRAAQEGERALERRSIRRLRSLVAIGLLAALVATTLTVVAATERGKAVDEARVSRARELSAAAVANLETDPELSILLATEAVDRTRSVDGSVLPEAEEALHRAVVASRVVMSVPGVGGLLAWSPKGVFVTEGPEGTGLIDIRDDETGETVRSFKGHHGDINDVAFSPDGSKLATTGDDGWLKVWNPSTGVLLSRRSAEGSVWGPSFSADGSVVAAAWVQREGIKATVRALDLTTNAEMSTFRVTGAIDTAVSPDGERIAVMSFWDTTRGAAVFDLETGERMFRLGGPNCCTFPDSRGVSWSPDGRSIATTNEDAVRVWDAPTGRLRATLLGHTGRVFSVAWSPDSSRLVSGGLDGTARVWDVGAKGASELMSLSAQETQSGIVGVAFSPDGTRVMAGDAGITAVKVWDVGPDGDAEWANIPRGGWMVEFTPDGRGVVLGDRDAVTIWQPHTGRRLRTVGPATDFWFQSLDVSPSGGSIVLGGAEAGRFGGEATRTFSIHTGEELYKVKHHLDVLDVAYSADGEHVVAGGWDGAAKIVDRTGQVIRVLKEEELYVIYSVRFSPDGSLVATAAFLGRGEPGTGRVKIWDWERGVVVRIIRRDARWVDFDPNGSRIALASPEGLAEIWDVETGTRVAELAGRSGGLNDIDYSPDGSLVATAGFDGKVRLFDGQTGSQQLVLRGSGCSVDEVAFSPDGTTLASTTCGGVRIWALDIDDLLQIARQNVTRSLTDEECGQYLHLERCPTA